MKEKIDNNYKYLYVLTLAIFILLISPMFLSKGMFLDGLYYAVISRNLSIGLGDYWDLFYSNFNDKHFMSHPPLVFWIEGGLFKIFGDSIYVEKIYSLFTVVLSGILIIFLWNIITEKKDTKNAWLPLFIFVVFPVISWSAVNNLLENTMMMFDLLAVLFIFLSFKKNRIINIFLSGVFLFLAVMSKGFPGLFPLSVFFFVWLITKKISFKRFILDTFLLTSFLLIPFALLYFFNEDAHKFFITYFNKQILKTIGQTSATVKPYSILLDWLNQLIFPAILVIFSIFLNRKKIKSNHKKTDYKNAILFFLIGLSGVLPIMISPKQRVFYLVPSMPFFAVSIALLLKELNYNFLSLYKSEKVLKFLKTTSLIILLVSLIFMFSMIGKYGRDKTLQQDLSKIASITGQGSNVGISDDLRSQWNIYAYMQRYYKISITTSEQIYKIILKSDTTSYPNYENVNIELQNYKLIKKASN